MQTVLDLMGKSFSINLGKFSLPVSYLQAGIVILLIFFLVLSLAQFRKHTMDYSMKGAIFGVFFGFLLALFIEGFLVISGKTVLTQVLGWKNAPAPISIALDAGRNKLIQVLGAQTQITTSKAFDNSTVQTAIQTLQSLNPVDKKQIKAIFCQP